MEEYYYTQKQRAEDAIQWERVAKFVDRRKFGMKYYLKYRESSQLIPPEPSIITKDEHPSARITMYKKLCEKNGYPYVEKNHHYYEEDLARAEIKTFYQPFHKIRHNNYMMKRRREKKRMVKYLRTKRSREIDHDPVSANMENSRYKQKTYQVVFPRSCRARPYWQLNGNHMKGIAPIFMGYRITDKTEMTP